MVGPVVARTAEVPDGVEEAAEEPLAAGNAGRRSTKVEGGALGRCCVETLDEALDDDLIRGPLHHHLL